MADKVQALVLPPEVAVGSEAQILPGIAGRWYPGVAYAPEALGLSLKDAKSLIADLGLPLEVRSVDAADVRDRFDRPAGSHAPSAVLRPDAERDRVNAAAAAEPILDAQGVPVAERPVESPFVEATPTWAEAQVERNTRLTSGERDPWEAPAEMTTGFSGIPLPDVGDPDALPPEVERAVVEAEVDDEFKGLKKDELQAEAERRGIPGASEMKADDLRAALQQFELEARGLSDGEAASDGE